RVREAREPAVAARGSAAGRGVAEPEADVRDAPLPIRRRARERDRAGRTLARRPLRRRTVRFGVTPCPRTRAAVLTAAAVLVPVAELVRADGAAELTSAVASWLASLDARQRHTAVYTFEDDERFDLRLAPVGLEGLRRDAMTDAQWQAWLAALGTTLSTKG